MGKKRPRVFVPNLSHHDFSDAKRFGDLVFLTEGWVSTAQVNGVFRKCWAEMKDCSPQDYILISSLPIINAAAAAIMGHKFGRVNFLVFRNGSYVPINIIVDPKEMEEDEQLDDGG